MAKSENQQGDRAYPLVFFGAGGVPVTGIDNTTIQGLAGANATLARDILTTLAGSVANVQQTFWLNSATGTEFSAGYEQSNNRLAGKWRRIRQKEVSGFFKDDWKLRPDLTLNLGVRYEWYGVPWERDGLYGITGTSFDDLFRNMYQPGQNNGSPTVIQLVGKNSPNPDKNLL